MIIVEQEKTYFVNFDNVEHITIAVNKKESEYAVIAKTISDNEIVLGIYKTEERAKEILHKIKDAIRENLIVDTFAKVGDFSQVNKEKYGFTPALDMPQE